MQVAGLGERPLIDSGGFPVVWIGDNSCPIGQDPGQGGTNCYGPGDVLWDAYSGAEYQIGSDWAIYPLGSEPSSSPAAGYSAPVLADRIYYVDSGRIIEKDVYSDGSATYADTGLSSPLADGTAGSTPQDLQRTTPLPGNTGGFDTPNAVGGYGPYATPDPPRLTDLGTYVDHGRLYDHQVDQYGNDYYQDLGPAPASSSSPASTGTRGHPAPSVPSVRSTAPSVGTGRAPTTTYPADAPAAEPTAADGQRLSGQSAAVQAFYKAQYGDQAAAVWVRFHNAQTGASGGTTQPTGTTAPSSSTSSTSHGTTRSNAPAISTTGNFQQWMNQALGWATKASFVQGIPNGLLVAGGAVGYQMLRQRRRY